jgi:hypothetical protein
LVFHLFFCFCQPVFEIYKISNIFHF